MKYCSKCGNQIADNARFCGRCGAPSPDSARPPVNQPVNQPVYQPMTQPVNQPVYQSAYQPAYQQPARKKAVKWWIPVVAVAAVAALILGAVLLIGAIGGMFDQVVYPEYSYVEELPAEMPQTTQAVVEEAMPMPEPTEPAEMP